MSIPVAYAHPDDVIAVFDHPAVWINGTAIRVIGVSWQLRGSFVVDRGDGGADIHNIPMGLSMLIRLTPKNSSKA